MKNKIICFHLFNDYSGSPRVLKNVLCRLLQEDIEVELITSRGGVLDELPPSKNLKRRWYNYAYSSNCLVTTLRYSIIQIYTFFVALGYMFDRRTVFYINTLLPSAPAIAAWIMGKKIIYHYHENAAVKSTFYRLQAWVMQQIATKIICVSEYQRSFLKRKKGVIVIPNTLEEKFREKLLPAPAEAFERKRVLMLGSLKKYKSPLEFISIARDLPEYNFEMVINDEQKNIESFLQENGVTVTENLEIYPRHEEVSTFYNRASLVVSLTNKELAIETFGLTALEAMSAGLPVIVPTVGGIAEMVHDGVNGFKIDVQNLTSIKNSIRNILSNKQLYLSLCNNSLRQSKNYDSNAIVEYILKISNNNLQ